MVDVLDLCDNNTNGDALQDEYQSVSRSVVRFPIFVVRVRPFAGVKRIAGLRHRQFVGKCSCIVVKTLFPVFAPTVVSLALGMERTHVSRPKRASKGILLLQTRGIIDM